MYPRATGPYHFAASMTVLGRPILIRFAALLIQRTNQEGRYSASTNHSWNCFREEVGGAACCGLWS